MHIPVYELHDGRAYDAFIKTTEAALTPTRRGIAADVRRVRLVRVTGEYYRRAVPANIRTLPRDQQAAIVTEPTPYRGKLWPLYQLHTAAESIARELNLISEENQL